MQSLLKMLSSTPLLLTTLLLVPSALSITTIQAYLAPTNAAASVLAVTPSATTYSIVCTSLCATAGDQNQATLVNGPSTAGLTQIQGAAQKTLVVDCSIIAKDKGNCTTKAISAGETRTVIETVSFNKKDVVITAGVELLGYKVVTATAEVNVTHVATTITSGTETVTSGVPKTTGSVSTSAPPTTRSTNLASNTPAQQTSSSSAAAAPTMAAERIGVAIVGLAGLMLAAL